MRALGLTAILFCALVLQARGDQMPVSGAENGQGYVFTVFSRCFVVTALHVVDQSRPGQVSLTLNDEDGNNWKETRASDGQPARSGYWWSTSDIAVIQIDPPASQHWNPCTASVGDSGLPEALGAIILNVDKAGTRQYIPVDVVGSDGGVVLLKGKPTDGQSCNLRTGLSGGLALDSNRKILGIVSSIVPEQCMGKVIPIAAINNLVKDGDFQLPIYPLSQQLNDAIFAADFAKYSQLAVDVSDPNSVDATQTSAILAAITDRSAPSLGNLNNTDVEKAAAQQKCELWIEARLQIARDLVRRGANVNVSGSQSGWTPLMDTAAGGESPCVGSHFADFLISNHAELDRRWENDKTALHMAIWGDINIPVIKALLAAGANAQLRDHDGYTPLMMMAESALSDVGDCWVVDDKWTVAFKLLRASSDLRLKMPGDPGKTVDQFLREQYGHVTPGFDRCMHSVYPDLPDR